MPSELKHLMAQELAERYGKCTEYLVVSQTKLNGLEATDLRRTLREQHIRMEVVKNRIAARALESVGLGAGAELFQGSSALVTGDMEMPGLCKVLKECAGKFANKLIIRGGLMGGNVLTPKDVNRLAGIPPLPVLHAQIAGGIQAPIAGVASAFQSLLRCLAYVLEGIRKQKEGEASPSAP